MTGTAHPQTSSRLIVWKVSRTVGVLVPFFAMPEFSQNACDLRSCICCQQGAGSVRRIPLMKLCLDAPRYVIHQSHTANCSSQSNEGDQPSHHGYGSRVCNSSHRHHCNRRDAVGSVGKTVSAKRLLIQDLLVAFLSRMRNAIWRLSVSQPKVHGVLRSIISWKGFLHLF